MNSEIYDENSILFMLKNQDNKYYIIPVDKNLNKIEDIGEIEENIDEKTKLVLEEISNLKNNDFIISWGEEKKDFCVNDYPDILNLLEGCKNFVSENGEKIIFYNGKNTLSLVINETDDENILSCELLLNEKYKNPIFLDDNIAVVKNVIYFLEIEKDEFHVFDELVSKVNKNELEHFLTLTMKYFSGITFDYSDYTVVEEEEISPIPYILIEKISQDKSLYLKVDLTLSTMSYEFFQKNSIVKVAIVNEMEKKITINKILLTKIYDLIDEISRALIKRQKDLKLRANFFLDEENLILLQEKLAKEFIMNDLLHFASKYKIEGTDNLKKYNIRPVKPKIVGKFGDKIDYLDSENVEIDIEGEKFSILDVVSTYKNGAKYISLSNGTNALINKKYIEKLERLFKEENNILKLSFFDYPLVEDMIESKILDSQIEYSKNFFMGINSLDKHGINMPLNLNAKLRKYQEYGYRWLYYLISNDLGGCLADDMGLGKTLQSIALLTKLNEEKRRKSLIVMPKSLIFNWEGEINRFSPQLKVGIYYGNGRNIHDLKDASVVLTTYGTVRNDIEQIKDYEFDIIILDESQNIKNINSQTTKAVMLLNGKNRIALSGTPIENNLSELYSLFRFLNPSMFGKVEDFNIHYAIPIQKDNDRETIEELRKKIYPFILRRVKKEVLKDLPDKIEKTMFIEMNSNQKQLYEERRIHYYNQIRSQIQENGLGKTQFYILQALNELRQITSCPEIKNTRVASSKREVLIHNIVEAVENGHKVLVFTNYINSIKSICEDLEKKGIKHISMTGGTKDRQELVEKFQNDKKCKVFVMTLKTGGVGLNLTAADTIFIYDPWWNKTVENQAIDRAYRFGQDRTVFSYKLILKDTIEEKILKLQEKKSELLDSLITEDNKSTKILTEKDIEFILGD
ncbi:SNF2-related protein [Fusobacterium sp. PH5-44]|uniref:DEAD/DEAH box helicase n=1 Tax=unclassified Fusobacterium TaxID=2648384 RepID=UPI003D1E38E9